MQKKSLLLIVGLVIITVVLIVITGQAGANFTPPTCNSDHHTNCVKPTPTQNPCSFWEEEKWEADCVSPTPIPSPTVTPSPTPSATPLATPTDTPAPPEVSNTAQSNAGTPGVAPGAPVCNIPFAAPVLESVTANGSGEITLVWGSSTNVDKYSLIYGLVGQPLSMGVDNIPSTSDSFTIGDLPVGSSINAQVWGWQNGCAEKSNILDPLIR